MDQMVYTVVQAQALRSLHEMVEETQWTEPGPGARLRLRLRATIGKRLIQVGKLLEASAEPRQQTQTA